MSRYLFTVRSPDDRNRAMRAVLSAPDGARVEVKAAKRTLPQNDRFWAMLTDIAMRVDWDGAKRTPGDWKIRFLNALNREARMMSDLDGTGVIDVGRRSSDLTKEEMSDVIELMFKYGAEHGVTFRDDA
jgi:hypothetical protein